MKVKISLEGDDEKMVKIGAIQGGVTPDQFCELMLREALRSVRESLELMNRGLSMNEAIDATCARVKEIVREP